MLELLRLRVLFASWGRETRIAVRCELAHDEAYCARANGIERVVRNVRSDEVQTAVEAERLRGVPRKRAVAA